MITQLFQKHYQLSVSSDVTSKFEEKIISYRHYLMQMRNLVQSTIEAYCLVACRFLIYFYKNKNDNPTHLENLTSQDVENFICDIGKQIGRRTLFNRITALRTFLRYLVVTQEISTNLDRQIDTPRIYGEEQLPRALDWKIVSIFLQSIDRTTDYGKRDYAMLFLIATYGLRASEVVNIKLEDIEWRECRLRIFQRKTSTSLLLPLIDPVANCLIEYLRNGRPTTSVREIFVKHQFLHGPLKPIVVSNVFNKWSQCSNLSIPFHGPHCLRHSLAVHLLRQGTPLKTIGDLLGHKNFSSTCIYLRLNIEDLNTVPLNIPFSLSIQGV